jgi:hypothetical protein
MRIKGAEGLGRVVLDVGTGRAQGRDSAAPSPDADGVALFSIIKWTHFQLSRYRLNSQSGPVFDYQMALFSLDKNIFFGWSARRWQV